MVMGVLLILALAFVTLGGARILLAPPRPRWALPAAFGVLAAALAWRWGALAIALGGAVFAAAYFWIGDRSGGRTAGESANVAAARTLLGLGPSASAEEIKAAHRAKISEAHPDRGGDAAYASRLNAARDLLLKKS